MLLYFNKNGQLLERLEYGSVPRVGTTEFKIFAYFEDIDLDVYSAALIRFRRPDLEGNTYPDLFMSSNALIFDDSIEHSNYFKETDNPYNGYVFNFNRVISDETIVKMLDTPGNWDASITLINSSGGYNVTGIVRFYVGASTNESEEMTELDNSVIINNIANEVASKVGKNEMLYVRYNANLLEAASEGTLLKIAYPLNSYVYDGTTKSMYQIVSVTDNDEDYEYAEVTKIASDDPVGAVQLALDNGTMKIVSANVNSESALVGQTLVSDGNGGAEWQTISSDFSLMTSITYSDLVSLKNAGTLIPGMKYRITDYTCTTTTTNTSSAGHTFDIIVTATSTDTLSEEAQATLHAGDTYFANSKLYAWKLWYSLENDTSRFAWVDATNGKGVIYRMIDEFGNDCPYDFKNIKFTFKKQIVIDFGATQYIYERNDTLDANGYYGWTTSATTSYGAQTNYWTDTENPSVDSVVYGDNAGTTSSVKIEFVSLEEGITYTFEMLIDNVVQDASLSGVKNSNYNCFGNIIKPYYYNDKLALNFIAFKSSLNNRDLGAYFNTFENDCYYMTFKYNCYSNTFNSSCYYNAFEIGCCGNNFDNNCRFNKIGDFSSYNIFGISCYFNNFNSQCSANILNRGCYKNRMGYGSVHNLLNGNNNHNIFGSICMNNVLDKSCNNNEFGNSCSYINLESGCSYIKTFDGTNVINYVRYVTVDSGCNNINICSADTTESGSNYLQNVHICYGVANQTIIVPDRNLNYEITYKMTGSTEVLL